MKIDDSIIYEEEMKMWEKYYGGLIENADSEEERSLYQALLQEKRDSIGVYINAKKRKETKSS